MLCSVDWWQVQTWQMLCGLKQYWPTWISKRVTGTSGQKRWNTRYPKYPMILKKIGYGLGIAKNYWVGSGTGYPSGQNCTTPPHHWDVGMKLGCMVIIWDPSQLVTIPNPDHPPFLICLIYKQFCTKKNFWNEYFCFNRSIGIVCLNELFWPVQFCHGEGTQAASCWRTPLLFVREGS